MNHSKKSLSERVQNITFEKPIPIGQLYFPEWDRYEKAFRGIFEREYYNNNGPLHIELENKLQLFLGVKHVICTSNATLGLMISAQALGLKGKVILPANTSIASAQSLLWAGLTPVFCDVDRYSHHIDVKAAERLIDQDVSAIMGVNLWGGASDIRALEHLATKHDLTLYFNSAQAFGCQVDNVHIGNFGQCEVFSFHATKILSAGEGGAVCTNDDALADKLRSIRPSYDDHNTVKISKVANARMSEAQAAIALMSLEDFKRNQRHNKKLHNIYQKRLNNILGIKLIPPVNVSYSNFQSIICEVDAGILGLTRDGLLDILKAKNVFARRHFYPGPHKTVDFREQNLTFPNTDFLSSSNIQLPIGALVDDDVVHSICDIIELASISK